MNYFNVVDHDNFEEIKDDGNCKSIIIKSSVVPKVNCEVTPETFNYKVKGVMIQ